MTIGYKQISEAELAWRENRENITLQGRQLLRRVLNEALAELDKQFLEGLERGEILEINPGQKELRQLLFDKAKKELTA
jgi:DNA-binding MarR family transcriptional regulator